MEMPPPQNRVIVATCQDNTSEFVIVFERETDGFHIYIAYTPEQALEVLHEHASWMLRSDLQSYERLHTLFLSFSGHEESHSALQAIHVGKSVAMQLGVALGIYHRQITIGEPLKYKIDDSIAWAVIPDAGEEGGIAVIAGLHEKMYQIYFVYSREQLRTLAETNRKTIHEDLYRSLCDRIRKAELPESSHQEMRVLTGGNAECIAEAYIYTTRYFQVLQKKRSDPDSGRFSKN